MSLDKEKFQTKQTPTNSCGVEKKKKKPSVKPAPHHPSIPRYGTAFCIASAQKKNLTPPFCPGRKYRDERLVRSENGISLHFHLHQKKSGYATRIPISQKG